jgi:hypothetical protein
VTNSGSGLKNRDDLKGPRIDDNDLVTNQEEFVAAPARINVDDLLVSAALREESDFIPLRSSAFRL